MERLWVNSIATNSPPRAHRRQGRYGHPRDSKQIAEMSAAPRSSIALACCECGREPIVQTLVVALAVIRFNKFVDGLAQGAFSEQNHPLQAGLLDGSDKALGVGWPDKPGS